MFQDFFGFNPTRKYGSYVEETSILLARLNARITTVVHRLVKMKKRGGQHQKQFAFAYGRTLNTAPKKSIENVE